MTQPSPRQPVSSEAAWKATAVPNSRRLPPELAGTFGSTEPGALRGGIHPAD